ncbi:MAG: sigma 54-interacting transcriptional regulator, partial [Nitrospiraceae bacterium]|nr:sigma 54-interacting transcriptional regulator [Nitrospiraceae bacterium]
RARGGTAFVDEIGELHIPPQGTILRVMQGKEFERVGGTKTIKVDVRIITATNKDLEQAIAEGKFREDLFYRLNVIPIHLPPLRERVEDIPLLVDFFKKEFAKKRKKPPLKITAPAMQCLIGYYWPGNVRELENLLERLSILVAGDNIDVSDLPPKFIMARTAAVPAASPPMAGPPAVKTFQQAVESCPVGQAGPGNPASGAAETAALYNLNLSDSGLNLARTVEQMEKNLIQQALEKTGGVKSKAAKLLGLNRTTLIEKMKKMDLESARAR